MSYTRYISQLFINEPASLEILLELGDKIEIQCGDLCNNRTKEKAVTKLQELGALYIDEGIVYISQFGKDIVLKCREEMER